MAEPGSIPVAVEGIEARQRVVAINPQKIRNTILDHFNGPRELLRFGRFKLLDYFRRRIGAFCDVNDPLQKSIFLVIDDAAIIRERANSQSVALGFQSLSNELEVILVLYELLGPPGNLDAEWWPFPEF